MDAVLTTGCNEFFTFSCGEDHIMIVTLNGPSVRPDVADFIQSVQDLNNHYQPKFIVNFSEVIDVSVVVPFAFAHLRLRQLSKWRLPSDHFPIVMVGVKKEVRDVFLEIRAEKDFRFCHSMEDAYEHLS